MAWRAAAGGLPPSLQFPSQQQQQGTDGDNDEEAAALSVSDQRTLYLVNIFIGNTARFLNSFSSLCEDKLSQLHRRLLHLDATLTLLEAKLEGTCPYRDVDGNSCEGNRADSSMPLGNEKLVDAEFEVGGTSGQAARILKADSGETII